MIFYFTIVRLTFLFQNTGKSFRVRDFSVASCFVYGRYCRHDSQEGEILCQPGFSCRYHLQIQECYINLKRSLLNWERICTMILKIEPLRTIECGLYELKTALFKRPLTLISTGEEEKSFSSFFRLWFLSPLPLPNRIVDDSLKTFLMRQCQRLMEMQPSKFGGYQSTYRKNRTSFSQKVSPIVTLLFFPSSSFSSVLTENPSFPCNFIPNGWTCPDKNNELYKQQFVIQVFWQNYSNTINEWL
jgi:hypothetical protein